MTDETGRAPLARTERAGSAPGSAPGRPARRHHWWRWALGGAAVLVALIFGAAALLMRQSAPPPLALPTAAARAPAGPAGGTWAVAAGSVAGFRVAESALGMSNTVAGRTGAVSGTIVVSGDRVTRAALRVDLRTIKVGGKVQSQFGTSLGTAADPVATFTLARPVTLGPRFIAGSAVTVRAPGYLAMHGTSRPVTVTLSGRRDGPALQAAGTIPVTFARWGIKGPAGFGIVGSLADHGVAEFLLVLHRQ